jgi:hypothetical protein
MYEKSAPGVPGFLYYVALDTYGLVRSKFTIYIYIYICIGRNR